MNFVYEFGKAVKRNSSSPFQTVVLQRTVFYDVDRSLGKTDSFHE
jgi:hypothetical protein